MAIRTVRLDDEAEATLRQIREATGLPISEALKQGLRSLKQQFGDASRQRPYDLYERLDLGPGGYTSAPSTETRRGVATALLLFGVWQLAAGRLVFGAWAASLGVFLDRAGALASDHERTAVDVEGLAGNERGGV